MNISLLLGTFVIPFIIFGMIQGGLFIIFFLIKGIQVYFFKTNFKLEYYLGTFGLSFIALITYFLLTYIIGFSSDLGILAIIGVPILIDVTIKIYFIYRYLSVTDIIGLVITSALTLLISLYLFTFVFSYFSALRTIGF